MAAQQSGSRGRPGAQLPLQQRQELAEAAWFLGCRPGDSPGPAASLISIRQEERNERCSWSRLVVFMAPDCLFPREEERTVPELCPPPPFTGEGGRGHCRPASACLPISAFLLREQGATVAHSSAAPHPAQALMHIHPASKSTAWNMQMSQAGAGWHFDNSFV